MKSKKKDLLKKYKKEEIRHDKVSEKETEKHEKRHKVELDKALNIGKCKKKKK